MLQNDENQLSKDRELVVTILSYSYPYVRSGLKRLKIDDIQVTIKLLEVFVVFAFLFIDLYNVDLYNVYNTLVCVLKQDSAFWNSYS